MSMMKFPRTLATPSRVVLTLALAFAVAAPALAIVTRTKRPAAAVFHLKGPVGIPIDGTSQDVRVEDDGSHVRIVVGLAALTTGMRLRDAHMRDKYLEVRRWPDTRLEVDTALLSTTHVDRVIEGVLTLHGTARKVPVVYRATCAEDVCDVTGSVAFDMRAFGVVVPAYFGLTVDHDVVVDVSLQVRRTEEVRHVP